MVYACISIGRIEIKLISGVIMYAVRAKPSKRFKRVRTAKRARQTHLRTRNKFQSGQRSRAEYVKKPRTDGGGDRMDDDIKKNPPKYFGPFQTACRCCGLTRMRVTRLEVHPWGTTRSQKCKPTSAIQLYNCYIIYYTCSFGRHGNSTLNAGSVVLVFYDRARWFQYRSSVARCTRQGTTTTTTKKTTSIILQISNNNNNNNKPTNRQQKKTPKQILTSNGFYKFFFFFLELYILLR